MCGQPRPRVTATQETGEGIHRGLTALISSWASHFLAADGTLYKGRRAAGRRAVCHPAGTMKQLVSDGDSAAGAMDITPYRSPVNGVDKTLVKKRVPMSEIIAIERS